MSGEGPSGEGPSGEGPSRKRPREDGEDALPEDYVGALLNPNVSVNLVPRARRPTRGPQARHIP